MTQEELTKAVTDMLRARHAEKTKGTKFDEGKAPMELLSHHALVEIAHVFGAGAVKYGRFNYRAGMDWGRVIGAAYRHLGAFNSGEDLDPETGRSHLAHLGACCIMLLDYHRTGVGKDDRHKLEVVDKKLV